MPKVQGREKYMYLKVCRYRGNSQIPTEKKRKRKEKEIHTGFVGIGGRTDHSIDRNQGTYLM